MSKNDLVTITKDEFKERITPKKVKDPKELSLFQCPECGNVHFKHDGYVEVLVQQIDYIPFVNEGKESIRNDSHPVYVCASCGTFYVWINEQMWNVTNINRPGNVDQA